MFCAKKIILETKSIKGDLTVLVPAFEFSKEITTLLSSHDLFQIFNLKSKSSIRNLINKPWNVFIDLYSASSCQKIGFLWIIINDDLSGDITIHGGGWSRSLAAGRLYLDSWRVALDYLEKNFISIRTSCRINNLNAAKFIERTGFKKIGSSNNFNYYLK